MKVAHIVCVFPPYKGGMGNSAYHFAASLAQLGHKITVYTPNYNNLPGEEEVENIKIKRIKPWLKFGNAAFIPQIFAEIRDYDIIHLHYPFFGAAETILAAKLFYGRKIKLALHYHMDTISSGWKGLFFTLNKLIIQPLVIKSADVVTCASLDYVQHSEIRSYYKAHLEKFQETLFGVDLAKFKPKEKLMTAEKNILFVAGLDKAHYFKGLEILLRAVKIISEQKISTEQIKLTVVGEGDLKPHYLELSKKLGIENMISFAGRVNDDKLSGYYNDCDVFVLPSINQGEAFGLVLLEAMASGKPVLASDMPGIRQVFTDGREGLLIAQGNAEDLARKLIRLFQNSALMNQMGKSARQLAEKKYSWHDVAQKLNCVYENLFDK